MEDTNIQPALEQLAEVRDPTTRTTLQKDGPNHLESRYNALPEHQMALITQAAAFVAGRR